MPTLQPLVIAGFYVLFVFVFLYGRQYLYLRGQVTRPVRPANADVLGRPVFDGDGLTLAETLGDVSMGAVDYLWALAGLDPNLVTTAERLNLAGVHGRVSLESFLSHHASTVAQAGWQNRVLGYMGEQRVADLLAQHGHVVTMASTLNQPAWDMFVDGHAVNVKTYQAVAQAKAEAASHPGIVYLLPDDAHGRAVGNIVKLQGFHHDVLASHLHASVGEAAAGGLLAHLPVGTAFVVGWRARGNYRSGMALADMASTAGGDLLFRGGGWMAGAALGAKAGLPWGHPHVGLVVGGVAGTVLGSQLGQALRHYRLWSSEGGLEKALADYGAFYARPDVVNALRGRLWAPIRVQEQWIRSLRQLRGNAYRSHCYRAVLWPTYEVALLNATITNGRASLRASAAAVAPADSILTGAMAGKGPARQRLARYGLLLANLPSLAFDYGPNHSGIQRIEQATAAARAERQTAVARAMERQQRRERRAQTRAGAYQAVRRWWSE